MEGIKMSEEETETEIDKRLAEKKKQLEEVKLALTKTQVMVKLKELSAQAIELITSILRGIKRLANAILEAFASLPEGISWWFSKRKEKAMWIAEKEATQKYLMDREQRLLDQETKMAEEWKKGADILSSLRRVIDDTVKALDMDTYKKKIEGEKTQMTQALVSVTEISAEMASDTHEGLEEIILSQREVVEKMIAIEGRMTAIQETIEGAIEPETPSYSGGEEPESHIQAGPIKVQPIKMPNLIFSPSFSLDIGDSIFSPTSEEVLRLGKRSIPINMDFHNKFTNLIKGFNGHVINRAISSLIVSENTPEQRKITISSGPRWFKVYSLSIAETGEIISRFDANLTIRTYKALHNFFEKEVLEPVES